MSRIVLASSSYSRQRLLALLGLEFEVLHSGFDEFAVSPDDFADKQEFVQVLATGKVLTVVDQLGIHSDPDTVVIGGDLSVFHEGRYYPKPTSLTQAREYMQLLGGKTHVEISASAVWSLRTGLLSMVESTQLTLPVFTEPALDTYIAKSNPLKKAGAVCLATSKKVEEHYHLSPPVALQGSVSGILGISVQHASEMLTAAGITIPRDWRHVEAELAHDILHL